MKHNIINRLKEQYKKTDTLSKMDWFFFGFMALFCFVSFCHDDIMNTGNRAWIYYDGLLDFYDNAAAWTRDNGANYMPSTFLLFAIWNLPLKLLGVEAPINKFDFRTGLCVWYKLLPLLFFFGSLYFIYQVAQKMGVGAHKAKLAMYIFATMPICFYSQFIFSQYDIFTVFFMLWGMYYYYRDDKHDMFRFSLLFGVAITFKYYAVLIFLVFLLVREKRVRYIVLHGICAILPFAIELIPYWSSPGFRSGVFGFGALRYASSEDFANTFSSFSYTKLGCAILVLWAYFVHAKNRKEETAWSLYFSCGMCFALFGFSAWHPQWLIFMAPFLVLGALISKHFDKFLWMDAGVAVVFLLYSVVAFRGGVDVRMLRLLAWKDVFDVRWPWYYMGDVLPTLSTNTTNSVFVAALLIYFVMKHPKQTLDDYEERGESDFMHLVRFRLVLFMAIFCFLIFSAAYVNTITPQVYVGRNSESAETVSMTAGTTITQELPQMTGTLQRVGIYTSWLGEKQEATLIVEIKDEEGNVLYETVIESQAINEKGYTEHVLATPLAVSDEHNYSVYLRSENGTEEDCIVIEIALGADREGQLFCKVNEKDTVGVAEIYYMLRCPDWNTAKNYTKN